MKLTLPWDAVMHDNHRFIPVKMGKGPKAALRLIASPEYREKKQIAEARFMAQCHGQPKLEGELKLHARCYFPDRRKRDSGNYRKLITDALSEIAFADDSQLVSETWEKAEIDRERPRIEITLEAA